MLNFGFDHGLSAFRLLKTIGLASRSLGRRFYLWSVLRHQHFLQRMSNKRRSYIFTAPIFYYAIEDDYPRLKLRLQTNESGNYDDTKSLTLSRLRCLSEKRPKFSTTSKRKTIYLKCSPSVIEFMLNSGFGGSCKSHFNRPKALLKSSVSAIEYKPSNKNCSLLSQSQKELCNLISRRKCSVKISWSDRTTMFLIITIRGRNGFSTPRTFSQSPGQVSSSTPKDLVDGRSDPTSSTVTKSNSRLTRCFKVCGAKMLECSHLKPKSTPIGVVRFSGTSTQGLSSLWEYHQPSSQVQTANLPRTPPLVYFWIIGGGRVVMNDLYWSLLQKKYFHPVHRNIAEQMLITNETFLIRPSARLPTRPLTLSFVKNCRFFHIYIRQRNDMKYALGRQKNKEVAFVSVTNLINFYHCNPIHLEDGTSFYLTQTPPKTYLHNGQGQDFLRFGS